MHSGIPSECQIVWIQIMGPNGLQRLSMDLHTKGLEESFVYEISDLYLIGIQYSTLIY